MCVSVSLHNTYMTRKPPPPSVCVVGGFDVLKFSSVLQFQPFSVSLIIDRHLYTLAHQFYAQSIHTTDDLMVVHLAARFTRLEITNMTRVNDCVCVSAVGVCTCAMCDDETHLKIALLTQDIQTII